jgi:hypothetical protein
VHTGPGLALCRIFGDARIDVYADGLMSYGPTRNPLPELVAVRVERVLHLDLVPGLKPILLTEWDVPSEIISTSAFRDVIKTMSVDGELDIEPAGSAVILGQYLAAGGLLAEAEELGLYTSMIQRCSELGHTSIVFKPHPSASAGRSSRLVAAARARGVELLVADEPALVETWFARGQVVLVVGCFSTALLTAQSLYGVPAARLGTDLMLERLTPYQNSNRIPVTLVDALVPEMSSPDENANGSVGTIELAELRDLVGAVSYAMQPELLAARRADAVKFLERHHESHARYFKRRRLTRLDLPGRLHSPLRTPLTGLARRVRRALRRLISRRRSRA